MSNRECKDGWIRTYVEYTKPQQSPTVFHTWTAISTIASAMRRRCWIDRSYYTLYPNLYVILVSESGVGMKSTALEIGTSLQSKAIPDLAIMRGKLTIGYLVDWMTQMQNKNPDKFAEVTVHCSEFKVFARGAYANSGLIEDLTDIYDCTPFEYRTKNQGIFIIEKPCINLRAASTPEWLTTGSAADFIGGGFSSRILPVAILVDEKQIANPKKVALSGELERKLILDLGQIGQLKGAFFITKEAEDLFEKWYLARDKYKSPDQRLKGYFSKKHTMVHKVAMAISASINDDLVITEEHIESALALMGKLELTMPYAYQGVAWGEQAKNQDKVLSKVLEVGCIPHSELLIYFHYCMTGEDLKKIVHTLFDEDKISAERIPTKGKPRVLYVTEDYIRKQIKEFGLVDTKNKFPITFQSQPCWFEKKKEEKGDKKNGRVS